MQYLLRPVLRVASAVVIVCTLLAYLAPFVSPALFRWIAFFGTAFPWLLIAHLALVGFWAYWRHRYALYHIGMLFLGWQHVVAFVGLNAGRQDVPNDAVTIASHNAGGLFTGVHLEPEEWDSIIDSYARFWEKEGPPAVLCLQETGRNFFLKLRARMDYPYIFELGRAGTAVLSRYPIVRGSALPFQETENTSMWADLQIGRRIVRIYNVHLQSNKVTGDTRHIVEEAPLDSKDTWKGVSKVLRKVGRATAIRARQADLLSDLMASSPYPVVLCGDFNDTPTSYVYSRLSEGLRDTFRERGFGLGITFAGPIPFLRIDYILCDPRLKIYSAQVLRDRHSDHYPVTAALGF